MPPATSYGCATLRRIAATTHPGAEKRTADGLSRVIRDADGRVVKHEAYEPTGESCSGSALMNGRIYSGDGRLLSVHEETRVSETASEIRVTDAAGKLRVILHHSDIDGGDPVTIREEWSE